MKVWTINIYRYGNFAYTKYYKSEKSFNTYWKYHQKYSEYVGKIGIDYEIKGYDPEDKIVNTYKYEKIS